MSNRKYVKTPINEVLLQFMKELNAASYAEDTFARQEAEHKAYWKASNALTLISSEHEANGAAFAIKIIDNLHIGSQHSDTTDKLFKGIKNTIRDKFKAETGVDPAPNYPVKAELNYHICYKPGTDEIYKGV